jgi:hypothetical protein
MTIPQFKKALQDEIDLAGFNMRIFTVYSAGAHTGVQFAARIDTALLDWLDKRFVHGVTKVNDTSVHVNTPNKKSKHYE